MSFTIGFIAFRELQVKGDTIPKPVGLGSYGCQVASVSSVLQVNIEHLSSDRQEGVGL